jgi:hypothetical protein
MIGSNEKGHGPEQGASGQSNANVPAVYQAPKKDSIPRELQQCERWLLWGNGSKRPLTTDGTPASKTNPAHWTDFARALAAAQQQELGIGLVLSPEDDLVCVDLDNAVDEHGQMRDWAHKIIGRFPDAYIEYSPSGRGLHIFCRADDASNWTHVITRELGEKKQAVEILAADQFVTLTGNSYHVDANDVAECNDAFNWLAAKYPKAATASKQECAPPACETPIAERLAQAMKIVAEAQPAIEGQGGHKSTFLVAQLVVRGCMLDDENSMLAMQVYNRTKCHPPWAEWELRHKVRQASGEGNLIRWGSELHGYDFSELLSPSSRPEVPNSSRMVAFATMTSAELDELDIEVEYRIDDCLVKGQPCVLAGPKKSLKTSFLEDLAISLATGEPFLNKLEVRRPCRVLLMSAESGLATLKETARRVAKSKSQTLAGCDNLFWSDRAPKLNIREHLEALRDELERLEVDVLVIDPAYLCMPSADAGTLMAQGELLRKVNEVCRSADVTLLLCHHTKKNGKTDQWGPPDLEDIAWAGFQEWARQWILVNRRERYQEGSGVHKLWLSTGGSAGHTALWGVDVVEVDHASDEVILGPPKRIWEVELHDGDETLSKQRTATQAKAERNNRQKEEKTKADVLMALKKNPDGLSMHALKQRAAHGEGPVYRALEVLQEDGRVEQFQKETKGQERNYYRLLPEANGPASPAATQPSVTTCPQSMSERDSEVASRITGTVEPLPMDTQTLLATDEGFQTFLG